MRETDGLMYWFVHSEVEFIFFIVARMVLDFGLVRHKNVDNKGML